MWEGIDEMDNMPSQRRALCRNGPDRPGIQMLLTLATSIVSIILAMIVGAIIIRLMGISPSQAYLALFKGAFGSRNSIGESLVKAVPLIFTGLSFAFAFRCGLINLGAEGQLHMGALASVVVAVYVKGLPAFIHLPLALAAGFIGGGLWGLLAGWFRVKYGASEIITTIMLNYVATLWVNYLVAGPLKEPPGIFPQSPMVEVSAQLPRILAGTRLHLGLIVAFGFLAVFYTLLWRMPRGFELRVVGQNPRAAAYAGMNADSTRLLAMFLAGGMGGLAGSCEMLGIQLRLRQGISPGYGFSGLAVALLGGNAPIGVLLSAILFGALRAGGNMMQMMSGVSAALTDIIQGIIILFVLAQNTFRLKGRSFLGKLLGRDSHSASTAGIGGLES